VSGKWVRSDGGSQPGAIVFLGLIGLVASAAIGAVAVLFEAHLLNGHTPWRRVPGALWALKAYPIVYTPFLVGCSVGLVLTVITIISTLFKRQKLHGEARWARIGEVRKGKLLGSSGIVLGKFGRKVMRFDRSTSCSRPPPARARAWASSFRTCWTGRTRWWCSTSSRRITTTPPVIG
jgi:type IV secretion system protein VirD4